MTEVTVAVSPLRRSLKSVRLGFELTRDFADQVIHTNFFIINRNLNADSEDRRRKGEATARQAEAAQKSDLEANCAAGKAPVEKCEALEAAAHDAAAAASDAAAAGM